MIEGLRVTIKGTELKELCLTRARHHGNRAVEYAEQIESLEKMKAEAVLNMSGGDPIGALKTKHQNHLTNERILFFISEHLKLDEEYLLKNEDLERIGIIPSRFF